MRCCLAISSGPEEEVRDADFKSEPPCPCLSPPGSIQYAKETSDPLERDQHVALNLNHEKLKRFLLRLQKH